MKLSKEYITNRLTEGTTVHDLAVEIANDMYKQYEANGTISQYKEAGLSVDYLKTIEKFERMIEPFAPKTIKAVDFMEANGIKVVQL